MHNIEDIKTLDPNQVLNFSRWVLAKAKVNYKRNDYSNFHCMFMMVYAISYCIFATVLNG